MMYQIAPKFHDPNWESFTLLFRQLQRETIFRIVTGLRSEILMFQLRYTQTVQEESDCTAEEKIRDPIVHKKYKELARLLHPDLAQSSEDEQQRAMLMSQAGEALMNNDLLSIEKLLRAYRVKQQTAEEKLTSLEYQIYHLHIEKNTILRSSLWSLYALEQEWADQGRDLLSYLKGNIHA